MSAVFDAGHDAAFDAYTCIAEYNPCVSAPDGLAGPGVGRPCCNDKHGGQVSCVDNACGSCIAEGTACEVGKAPCCGGLACNSGTCGTSQCLPDGASCADAGAVCCNDDCFNGYCGGAP